jgi:hypothetical protein
MSVKLSYFVSQTSIVDPSISIRASDVDRANGQLFIEAGPMGIAFVFLNADRCFSDLVVYSFPPDLGGAALEEMMKAVLQNEVLARPFPGKTHILWAFPECMLVPNEYMDRELAPEMLDLVYGLASDSSIRSDFMFRHNLHAVYRLPRAIADAFSGHFVYADQTHEYALLRDITVQSGSRLFVIFYNSRFTAMLVREGQLQVIRHFSYRDPEDAAYHLLNTCEQFGVNRDELELRLCGMVDIRSNLYAELHKYFLNIGLEELPEDVGYKESLAALPHHYYSYLFDLALCG